jgi:hypothetical protein
MVDLLEQIRIAIEGRLGGGDAAVVWLTVPLSGPSTPES